MHKLALLSIFLALPSWGLISDIPASGPDDRGPFGGSVTVYGATHCVEWTRVLHDVWNLPREGAEYLWTELLQVPFVPDDSTATVQPTTQRRNLILNLEQVGGLRSSSFLADVYLIDAVKEFKDKRTSGLTSFGLRNAHADANLLTANPTAARAKIEFILTPEGLQ